MTQTAVVTKLIDNCKAEISVVRQSACGHGCENCEGCSTSSSTRVDAVAENLVGARPGDTVVVESSSGQVLGLASVFYLVPLVLLFVGYFVASALGCSDGVSMVIGLVLGAASFLISWRIDRRRHGQAVKMEIVEVLHCSDT